jgi:hypothetical protein
MIRLDLELFLLLYRLSVVPMHFDNVGLNLILPVPTIIAMQLRKHSFMDKVVAALFHDQKIYMADKASNLGTTQGRELFDNDFGLLLVVNWYVLLVSVASSTSTFSNKQ